MDILGNGLKIKLKFSLFKGWLPWREREFDFSPGEGMQFETYGGIGRVNLINEQEAELELRGLIGFTFGQKELGDKSIKYIERVRLNVHDGPWKRTSFK